MILLKKDIADSQRCSSYATGCHFKDPIVLRRKLSLVFLLFVLYFLVKAFALCLPYSSNSTTPIGSEKKQSAADNATAYSTSCVNAPTQKSHFNT